MSGKNNTALHPFTPAQSKFMEEHYSLLEWFLSFGKSYGNIYYCTNCGAYVGVHDGTKKPLGTLANAALRNKRREAHNAFDPLWRKRGLKRSEAYHWLAKRMKLLDYRTHIAQFTMAQCQEVIEICNEEMQKEAA